MSLLPVQCVTRENLHLELPFSSVIEGINLFIESHINIIFKYVYTGIPMYLCVYICTYIFEYSPAFPYTDEALCTSKKDLRIWI